MGDREREAERGITEEGERAKETGRDRQRGRRWVKGKEREERGNGRRRRTKETRGRNEGTVGEVRGKSYEGVMSYKKVCGWTGILRLFSLN